MRFSQTSLRYRAEYLAYRLVGFIFTALPLETSSAVSGRLWRILGPLLQHRHARAVANLKAAYPEKTESEIAALVSAMWDNIGRTFAETFRMDEVASSGRITVEDPLGILDEIRASPKGQVICCAHQANWEIAIGALDGAETKKPACIYQRLKNPLIDRLVRESRAKLYPGGVVPKAPEAARQLIKLVRAGHVLAILADQRNNGGHLVPFFNRLAPSTPFPALVARTQGVKLYAGQLIRDPDVRFRFRIVEIPVPETEDRDADMLAASTALQAELERGIREHPEQWMWSHRRWG